MISWRQSVETKRTSDRENETVAMVDAANIHGRGGGISARAEQRIREKDARIGAASRRELGPTPKLVGRRTYVRFRGRKVGVTTLT